MAAPCFSNVFVGAETGLLKGVNVQKKSWVNLNSVEDVHRDNEITAMCWGHDQSQICLGLRNRNINMYNGEMGDVMKQLDCTGGKGPIRGLALWNDTFVTCVESGLLKVWKEEEMVEVDVGGNVHRMRQNTEEPHLVATGGKENDLKIWDLESPTQPIFKAKNVRHDWLELRVPVWVTDMAFIPGGQKVVTSTGHHQVRLYDPNTPQRRPELEVLFDEYPLTAMGLRPGGNQVVVGNTQGNMALVDLRKAGKLVHQFKGFAGSVRCIECHSSENLVASCGLDRNLRIHDIDEKKLLHKLYLKSRLNCLLFADAWDEPKSKHTKQRASDGDTELSEGENSGEDVEDEDDELWDHMPEVNTQVKKRPNEAAKTDGSKKHKKGMNQNSEDTVKTIPTKRRKRSKRGKKKGTT